MQHFRISSRYAVLMLTRITIISAAALLPLCFIFVGLLALIPSAAFLSVTAVGFFYIRRRKRSIEISLDDGCLHAARGVFFYREDIIPRESVCYVSTAQTPLMTLLKITHIRIFTDRGSISVPVLDNEEAEKLLSALTNR